jgi:hypothetical protein
LLSELSWGAGLLGVAGVRAPSFAATYFEDKTESVEDDLVQFLFRNPEDHRLRMRTITRPSDGWKWGGTFD